MAFLIDSYQSLLKELSSDNITLIAVSKTKPEEDIIEAYQSGHRDFGENYVQELVAKQANLPQDIRWHFIGHLQSNKVKYIAPFVHLIHGVDSEKLLDEINKQGKKQHRIIPCLLQAYIATEESKFGLNEEELDNLINKIIASPENYSHVSIAGLMGMASFTSNEELISKEFSHLKRLFDQYRVKPILTSTFKTLSMGMSADYQIAISCGSNMVRIGSLIFGDRAKTQ